MSDFKNEPRENCPRLKDCCFKHLDAVLLAFGKIEGNHQHCGGCGTELLRLDGYWQERYEILNKCKRENNA